MCENYTAVFHCAVARGDHAERGHVRECHEAVGHGSSVSLGEPVSSTATPSLVH